jgi:oxalate decarboxylase/phosphoglucose isomerase-like protein (cupin superfamily)
MGAYINIVLHNGMNHPQWFTVTDNTAASTVFDNNMGTDAAASVSVALAPAGYGDVTYVPKGYMGTQIRNLSDGDRVDMI